MTDQITLGNIIAGGGSIVWIIVGVIVVVMNARKVRRENESDAAARTKLVTDKIDGYQKSMDERVRELEFQARDFMPRSEIEGRIEHLKANRMAAEDGIQRQLDKLGAAVGTMGVQVGKLEERHEGMAATQIEIKELVKEVRAEMKAGFKEISDQRKAA